MRIFILFLCLSTSFQLRCFSNDKVVLITGASKGIGLATAELLAEKGYTVYAGARSITEELQKSYSTVHFLSLDVTQDESVTKAVEQIMNAEGHIDVLINNAGYGLGGPLETLTIDELQKQFDVNYFGIVRMCQAVAPYMRKQHAGHIVNISSFQGAWGLPHGSAYSSSKAAVEMLSDALHIELLPWNIHVSVVQAGYTTTQFTTVMGSKKLADGAYDKTIAKFDELEKIKKENFGSLGPCQSAKEVALFISNVLEESNPKLRYQTSSHSKEMVELRQKESADKDYLTFIKARYKEFGLLP